MLPVVETLMMLPRCFSIMGRMKRRMAFTVPRTLVWKARSQSASTVSRMVMPSAPSCSWSRVRKAALLMSTSTVPKRAMAAS